jgi:hypothetical protein
MGLTAVKAPLSDKRKGRRMGGLLIQSVRRGFAPIAEEPHLTLQRVRRTDARIE